MEYGKVKSAAKQVTTKGPRLSSAVLNTLRTISDIVGATLGPGGQQVLIERYEHAMGPSITKDGVTVFRSLGFQDAASQCIMEAARDCAIRTASKAGDGTTTATVLSEAIVRYTNEYCTNNKRVSPQRVVRFLESQFSEIIEPAIQKLAIKADFGTEEGQSLLRSVAKISANGDDKLADAVMQCFAIVGDEGNVTITEVSGPSHYEVEQIDGYPIPIGYEDCCAKFYPKFVNDPGTQTCRMESPVFILYHGTLTDVNTAYALLSKVGDKFEELIQGVQSEYKHHNVVFVAVGFSETVLATFAAGWSIPNAIKIFPLTVPKSPMANFQSQFLEDLSAITGAKIFDPINHTLDTGKLEDLGPSVGTSTGPGAFESTRFRSSIIGRASAYGEPWASQELEQFDIVQQLASNPESEMDKILLDERLGKLTGGIAKLKVIGASNGELKEKRDRAEDAVCAVRGALEHGCLPGGGWTLLKVASLLPNTIVNQAILKPALAEPVFRLLANSGMEHEEAGRVIGTIIDQMADGRTTVYDLAEDKYGDPIELGILDSTPAVLEAIRNSISIASLLGTLGGVVVFARDEVLERQEAKETQAWLRDANTQNEADLRS